MMKKIICALLVVGVLCTVLALAMAEAGSADFVGRWQDPAHDRALLTIMRTFEVDAPEDEIWYDVALRWPNASEAETVWYMIAKYDDGTQKLVYTDGVKAEVTYGKDGTIATEENVWDDSEGTLVLIDGRLQWTDKRENELKVGEPTMVFERTPRTSPTAEAFLSEYFLRVAKVEEGTAGSSLKQAIAARDVARFALSNHLWDADTEAVQQNMRQAWASMSEEDRATFDANFREIFQPMLEDAFGNYLEVAGAYDDAGVGEDMALIAENMEARLSWEALLANTTTLGSDDGK